MAGTAQEEAARNIGRQMLLAGVPAPTALDGFRPAFPDELKTFLIATGTAEQNAEDVVNALRDELDITSIVQFGEWFSDEDLREWFKSHENGRRRRLCSSL